MKRSRPKRAVFFVSLFALSTETKKDDIFWGKFSPSLSAIHVSVE